MHTASKRLFAARASGLLSAAIPSNFTPAPSSSASASGTRTSDNVGSAIMAPTASSLLSKPMTPSAACSQLETTLLNFICSEYSKHMLKCERRAESCA